MPKVNVYMKTSMTDEIRALVEHAGSSHDEFDRMLMSGVLEAKYLTQFLTKTLGEKNGINVAEIKEKVKGTIKKDMEQFFPSTDEDES